MGAWAGAGMMAGGGIMGAFANWDAGNAAKALGDAKAEMYEQSATDAIIRGEHEATNNRMKVSTVTSKQRTAYAVAGVDVDSGTALDVQQATALLGEYDTQMIRANAFITG